MGKRFQLPFWLLLILVPCCWAFSAYAWVEFVKVCNWLGQYTWP